MNSPQFRIFVSRSAEKSLLCVPSKDRLKIIAAIQALASQPFPAGAKKLTGEESTFRIRVGNYRVIYEVGGKRLMVLVLKIGHRKDVYR